MSLPALLLHEHADLASVLRQLRQSFLAGPRPDAGALLGALGEALGATVTLRHQPVSAQWRRLSVLAVPVISGDRWLGDLVLHRPGPAFGPGEQLLAEAAAAMAGWMMAAESAHAAVETARRRAAAREAVANLTPSERRGMRHLLRAWQGRPVRVCLVKAAASARVHHSTLIQALNRLRAAGVVSATSCGRRGVHLDLLNPLLVQELEQSP